MYWWNDPLHILTDIVNIMNITSTESIFKIIYLICTYQSRLNIEKFKLVITKQLLHLSQSYVEIKCFLVSLNLINIWLLWRFGCLKTINQKLNACYIILYYYSCEKLVIFKLM